METEKKPLTIISGLALILILIGLGCTGDLKEYDPKTNITNTNISAIKENPGKFNKVIVDANYQGAIARIQCTPYHGPELSYGIEGETESIKVKGDLPNASLEDELRLKAKVKVYQGPLGCGKMKNGSEVKPDEGEVVYLKAINSTKINGSKDNKIMSRKISTLDFKQVNSKCGGEGGAKIKFDQSQEEKRIEIKGTVSTSDPCYNLTGVLVGSLQGEKNILFLDVTSESTGKMCMQCTGSVSYSASITNLDPVNYNIIVKHNGKEIKSKTFDLK